MSDYRALTLAGYAPLAAAQIAKAGDPVARAAIAEARGK